MAITHMQLLVASAGLIKIEQADEDSFKLMRAGQVDSYLGHLTEHELRDLHEVAGDLLTYLEQTRVSEVA